MTPRRSPLVARYETMNDATKARPTTTATVRLIAIRGSNLRVASAASSSASGKTKENCSSTESDHVCSRGLALTAASK